MRMIDILPSYVREWITHLQTDTDIGPKTITNLKSMLSAIVTAALNDQVVYIHAVKGVNAPTCRPSR